jgi:competence protein ComEC
VQTCPASFLDLPPDDPFYSEVMSLNSSGVVSGYSDGRFRPYDAITRGQVAKIVVLAFSLPVVSQAKQAFSDLDVDNPFSAYIYTAYDRKLISGYADSTYRPSDNVTRGQVAKLIVQASGWVLLNPEMPTFSDVGVESVFYKFVETAYGHGVLGGYPDGSFKPDAVATRGQVSKLVLLAATPSEP